MTFRSPTFLQIFRFPLWLAFAAFSLWQLLRVLLWWHFGPAGCGFFQSLLLFSAGVHIDAVWALLGAVVLISVCALLTTVITLPAAVVALSFGARAWRPTWRLLFRIAITVGCSAGIFLLISEWYFFAEFDSRFNTVAIDYLVYPHEVFTNLRESYPLTAIFMACAAGGVTLSWIGFTRFTPAWSRMARGAKLKSVALTPMVCMAAYWSVSPKETDFSRHRVVNELANNGWASASHAAWSRNLDYSAFYRTMGRREAFVRARRLLEEPGVSFVAEEPPHGPPASGSSADEAAWLRTARDSIARDIAGDPSASRFNICVVTEESMGSEFWGVLGRTMDGKPHTLTPRMDEIASKEGLLFTNMLADGNRTIRGMEAIYSSIPPLPGDSILARDKSENVETIARVLKRDGYQTLFLYGGRGSFDYIRSYALQNGWDRLIDEADFDDSTFRTAWGVSDEFLLQRGISEMRQMHAEGRPFFVSVLTGSNHRPFTYPAGRIPEDPLAKRRDHAVRYADWALGQFFDQARQEPFWQDTIFVVVADHGARVYGSQTIPLSSYQIPCVIVAPGLIREPRRSAVESCQLDVAPTILGMLKRPYRSLFYGHDVLKEHAGKRTRCLMHHNRSVAAYHKGKQVVLGLNKTVEYWKGDISAGGMERVFWEDPDFEEIRDDGVALFQTADDLYKHRLFNVPATESKVSQ